MAEIAKPADSVKDEEAPGLSPEQDRIIQFSSYLDEQEDEAAPRRAKRTRLRERTNGGAESTKRSRQGDNRPGGAEDAVALDFARKHSGDFCYIAKWGRWMCWDGGRWQHEDTLRAFDEARVLCREADDAKAKTVAAVVTLARADRALAATEEQWDIEGFFLNMPTTKESKS